MCNLPCMRPPATDGSSPGEGTAEPPRQHSTGSWSPAWQAGSGRRNRAQRLPPAPAGHPRDPLGPVQTTKSEWPLMKSSDSDKSPGMSFLFPSCSSNVLKRFLLTKCDLSDPGEGAESGSPDSRLCSVKIRICCRCSRGMSSPSAWRQ